jgi:hypothetical protein
MKQLKTVLAAVVLSGLLCVAACQADSGEAHTSIPTSDSWPSANGQLPDDVMATPGGVAYRANVHQQGIENPWPPIESETVQLERGSSTIRVQYRKSIETAAGETRNNIIYVAGYNPSHDLSLNGTLNLYIVNLPSGLVVSQIGEGSLGMPGMLASILTLDVSPGVADGEYNFEIGVEIDGQDYGTVPCILTVRQ